MRRSLTRKPRRRAARHLSPVGRASRIGRSDRQRKLNLDLAPRLSAGLAAGVALALLGLRLRHGLDVSTEILPWHDLLDRFQRIAQSANRIQPALNIEKALLPHDPLAPSAHDRVRSPSQIRGDLARGIFRGAHKPKSVECRKPSISAV